MSMYLLGSSLGDSTNLSLKPIKTAAFSSNFPCFVFQPHAFSLVFALAGRNNGSSLSKCQAAFSVDNKPSTFESEIYPLHKPALRARAILFLPTAHRPKGRASETGSDSCRSKANSKSHERNPFRFAYFLQIIQPLFL